MIKLRDRLASSHGDINPETTIGKLAEVWLGQVAGEQRLAPQTLHGYRRIVANMVVPGVVGCGCGRPPWGGWTGSCAGWPAPVRGLRDEKAQLAPDASGVPKVLSCDGA